jgi:hypothetical protein
VGQFVAGLLHFIHQSRWGRPFGTQPCPNHLHLFSLHIFGMRYGDGLD